MTWAVGIELVTDPSRLARLDLTILGDTHQLSEAG